MGSEKFPSFCIASLCSPPPPKSGGPAAANSLVSPPAAVANPRSAATPASITAHNASTTRLKRILTLTLQCDSPAAAFSTHPHTPTPSHIRIAEKNRNYPFDVGNGSLRFTFFLLTLLRRTDR